ncbi:hypothetical protein HY768_08930 [candidate division TA06 bacterium]|uniref:Uncharacterized protein n=1 Tax=candidate division TA06 bacterium TaxID=2250710 RepID=A0A933MLB9_UNCT6|nr:hypothetical protein [candidate division TA06 bacterium]
MTIDINPLSWNYTPLITVDKIGTVWTSWYHDAGGGYISFNKGSGWNAPDSLGITFSDICSDSSGNILGVFFSDSRDLYGARYYDGGLLRTTIIDTNTQYFSLSKSSSENRWFCKTQNEFTDSSTD